MRTFLSAGGVSHQAGARAAGSGGRVVSSAPISENDLDALIECATEDAFDESEELAALFNMIESEIELPLTTQRDGHPLIVERFELLDGSGIFADCLVGPERHRLPLLDLELPEPAPPGAEWIHAYRRWATRRKPADT